MTMVKTGAHPPNCGALPKANFSDDMLRGAHEIAAFLFGDPKERRKVYHLAEKSRLPVTEAATAEWSRQLAALVHATETWIVTEAADACANAAANGASPKELAALLRRGYTALRQRLADASAPGGAADRADVDDDTDLEDEAA